MAEPEVRRMPLSRERVLRAAMELADRGGLGSLTMRRLGQELGVEAMSLYKHVANKDEILDGLGELIVAEVDLPAPGDRWKPAMRRRAVSARSVFARHPWATTLLETRANPGAATLRYYDAVIGSLRGGGFSLVLAAHAFSVLDSYLRGFAAQEQSLPFQTSAELTEVTEDILEQFTAADYPHLAEMGVELMTRADYAHADEFEFGLDLILDGLERALERENA
jgi:AcrR family transcriptional regulator